MLKMPRVRRVQNLSLREQVVAILREAILTCRLAPGTVLNERDLADQLGVSKTPIREALSLLNHDNLVQIVPRQAYVVSPITIRDVHESFDLRVILECAAAELAAGRINAAELTALGAIVAGESAADSPAATLERNLEFHSAIAVASGNERLAALIGKLLSEMPRLITVGYIKNEHEDVMDALRAGDPARAHKAMREHILAVKGKALGAAVPEAPRPRAVPRVSNVAQP